MSTIVTRAGKGSALTHNEVDANFTNLNNDKVEAAQSVTLTNKTISGSNNTLSNISNASLTNSSVTIGSTSVSLGSTATTVAGLTLSSPTISDNAVINSNSSSTALRITQTGTGNALVVEDAANPDSTPFVIDASGIVVHGNTASVPVSGITEYEQLHGVNGGSASKSATAWSAASASTAPNYTFARSRGSSVGDYTTVNAGDTVGLIQFRAADGSQMITSAYIVGQVDGTPGTNDIPGRLVFSTTADGAATPTERMRIDSAGNVGIGTQPTTITYEFHLYKNQNAQTTIGIQNPNAGAAAGAGISVRSDTGGGAILIANSTGSTSSAITGGASGAGLYTTSGQTNGLSVGTTAGPLKFFAGSISDERMRIDSSGNVGIGTSSPGAKLDTKGLARSSIGTGTGAGGAAYAFYQFGTSATATENWHIGTEGDGSFRFYNQGFGAGLERFRIGASGQWGLSGANYGTSGQVLTSQGSGSAPIWSNAGSGMTLLGTLTTTSGTTAVLSGLDLTSYKAIFISINRCSHTSGSNQEFQLLDANGSTYLSINPATAASAFVSGICQISLINGAIASNIGTNATSATPLVDSPSGTVAGITTFSTSATSFTFRFAAGNFDNGSISVYGVK